MGVTLRGGGNRRYAWGAREGEASIGGSQIVGGSRGYGLSQCLITVALL